MKVVFYLGSLFRMKIWTLTKHQYFEESLFITMNNDAINRGVDPEIKITAKLAKAPLYSMYGKDICSARQIEDLVDKLTKEIIKL